MSDVQGLTAKEQRAADRKNNWKAKHEELIRNIRAARGESDPEPSYGGGVSTRSGGQSYGGGGGYGGSYGNDYGAQSSYSQAYADERLKILTFFSPDQLG